MTAGGHPLRFVIRDESSLGIAVIGSFSWPVLADWDKVKRGAIVTVVSELGRNILKYAFEGTIEIRVIEERARSGIEIVAWDRGPGIPDISQAMRDSFSTGGTLGLGLPGVRRMMDEFALESNLETGTRVTVRKWKLKSS